MGFMGVFMEKKICLILAIIKAVQSFMTKWVTKNGKMKSEIEDVAVVEVIGSISKIYSFLKGNN